MSEFVAGAFVDVKPDAKGFRQALKKDVDARIKGLTFKVPIEFDVKSFKKKLQDQARAAKVTIPIQVGGNVETIRRDLNSKIKKATEGLAFKVPVEFVQTGAGSRGGAGGTGGTGGTGGRGGGGGAGKRKALTDEEKQAIAVAKALDTAQAKQIATENALASARERGLGPEERAIRLSEARTTANAAVRTTTDALARSEASLTAIQRADLETARSAALAQRAIVVEKQKALKISQLEATTTVKVTEARAATTAAMAVEVTEIADLNTLHVLENELLAAEATLKRSTTAARKLGLTALVDENVLLAAEITKRKELIAVQRLELKGQGARATANKTTARGAGASILSLLGLRGATLAASGEFLRGAAAAAIFTKSLKAFSEFESELNTFQAVAGATADQMKEVSRVAEELGADITLPAVSASDAAKAMTELARAGLDVRNSIAGARGVLELATAAQIDNAEAAVLVATGLNAFSLSGEQAVHVADLLANAANAAQGSISEMGSALQQAAAISHQVGISLDDTVGILTLFARNGLRGSDAGTSLRTALARLIAPTAKASALIEGLGLNIRDANGNVRPEVFADFGEATHDISPALRDMIAETIAGQDSIRAFAIGAREGARGLKLARLQMAQTGTAAQVAAARTKGLAGEFSALTSNSETLAIKLGQLASGPVEVLTTGVNDLITTLNQLGSGDFSGAAETQGKRLATQLEGVKKLALSTNFDDFGKNLQQALGKGPDEKTGVEKLLEQLDSLQKIRITAFQAGIPVGPITAQIKAVRAELAKAKVDAGLLIPLTPLQKIKAPFQEAIRGAQEFKRALQEGPDADKPEVVAQIAALEQIIKAATPKMKAAIKKFKEDANKAFKTGPELADTFQHEFSLIAGNIKLATPEVLSSIDDQIRKIRGKVGTGPPALGKKIAKSIQLAIIKAIAEDDPELAAALKEKALKIARLFEGLAADALKNVKIPLTENDIAKMILPDEIDAARAEAAGDVAGQIAAKQNELKELRSHLPGGGALKQVRKGSQEEFDLLQQIIGVRSEIKGLKDDATDTTDADTAILDAISGKEQGLLNARAIAETTKTLKDDIRAARNLRAFYIKQITIVAQTIKDKEARNKAIADLKQKLFDLDLDITQAVSDRADQIFDDAAMAAEESVSLADDLRVAQRRVRFWERQVEILEDLVKKRKATAAQLQAAQDKLDEAEKTAREKLRDRRQQQRENRQERFDLKIQIAEANGNVKAEIAAREAQIRYTKELIRQTRKGSLQRLRLIAQLRQEQRELRDLKEQKEENAKEAQAVIFAFMQAQQGFAANLLSNLVPFNVADNTLGAAGAGPPGTSGSSGSRPGGSSSAGGAAIGTLSDLGGVDPKTGRPILESGGPPVVFPPGEGLAREATVQAAAKPSQGFTNTQAARLIALTAQMVSLLGGRVNKDSHPHAKTQRKRSGGSADIE